MVLKRSALVESRFRQSRIPTSYRGGLRPFADRLIVPKPILKSQYNSRKTFQLPSPERYTCHFPRVESPLSKPYRTKLLGDRGPSTQSGVPQPPIPIIIAKSKQFGVSA